MIKEGFDDSKMNSDRTVSPLRVYLYHTGLVMNSVVYVFESRRELPPFLLPPSDQRITTELRQRT